MCENSQTGSYQPNMLQQTMLFNRSSTVWWPPSGLWGCSSWFSTRGSSGTTRRGSTSISCSSRRSRTPAWSRGGRRTSVDVHWARAAKASERRTHRDVVALSDVGAQDAGHHAAEVQQGHAAAPAVVRGSLALHAREAEQPAATWGRGKTPELSAPDGRMLIIILS